ncbi:T-cell receptor alpha chain V region PHDS58 [Sigmodon hispidus]
MGNCNHFPACAKLFQKGTRCVSRAMLQVLISFLGMYFVLGDVRAQSVTQPDAHVTVLEGDSVELSCNYSYSGVPYLFWYMQHPGNGLQFLLKYYSGDPVVHGMNGFEAKFQKSNSSFHLKKTSVHPSDSAVYFCAVSAQCLGPQGELNTNL